MNPAAAAGRIILDVKTSVAALEHRCLAVSEQELRVSQELP